MTPKATDNNRTWALVEQMLAAPYAKTIFLSGEPGIGKTFAALRLGSDQTAIYVVTLTEDTPCAELRGHYLFKGQDAEFHLGPFARAMLEGARLVVNEVSHAPPEVHTLMHAILESPQTARLTLPNGETIRPAPGFKVVLTDNRDIDSLPEAIRDRIDAQFVITDAHPDALTHLSPRLRKIWKSTRGITGTKRLSLRDAFRLDNLLAELNLDDACFIAFGAERGPQVHDAIVLMEAGR